MGQSIFDIAGSAMRAQTLRLNTTASNMANASSVAGTAEEAYRARHPVFAAVLENEIGGVQSRGVVESTREPEMRYQPGHPLANEEGYVFGSNVDNHKVGGPVVRSSTTPAMLRRSEVAPTSITSPTPIPLVRSSCLSMKTDPGEGGGGRRPAGRS